MSDYPMTTRPISTWPGTLTPGRDRRDSPFGAPLSRTMETLNRELHMVGATDVIMEVALREEDFRIDGRPRAHARAEHPGVILSFGSKHGPLRYATDTFWKWQDNLRAIALGLEALRKVERYGITKRGEQYVGWRQIEATSSTATEARSLLQRIAHVDDSVSDQRLVRLARAKTHPDRLGTPKDGETNWWALVQDAAERLGVS